MSRSFVIAAAYCLMSVAGGSALALPQVFVSVVNGVDSATCGTRTAPCRTLTHGQTLTDNFGKLIILDSGNYGTLLINRYIHLINGSPGVALMDGITVTAGVNGHVAIDGIHLNGRNATNIGIYVTQAYSLKITNCDIRFYTVDGIYVGRGATAQVDITDTVVANNGRYGITLGNSVGGGGASRTLNRVTVVGQPSNSGLFVWGGDATVVDSVFSHNNGPGIEVYPGEGPQKVRVFNSSFTGNSFGVLVKAGSALIGGSVFQVNGVNVEVRAGAFGFTRGDNTFDDNPIAGTLQLIAPR